MKTVRVLKKSKSYTHLVNGKPSGTIVRPIEDRKLPKDCMTDYVEVLEDER